MTTFEDGPAKGQALMLKRAPVFLRVTHVPQKVHEAWDALDQPDDEPRASEQLFTYVLTEGGFGFVHIKASKGGGFYKLASYKLWPNQPTDAEMRDTAKWRAWCKANDPRK